MFRAFTQRVTRAVSQKMSAPSPSTTTTQMPFTTQYFTQQQQAATSAQRSAARRRAAFYSTTTLATAAAVCPVDHKSFQLKADTNYVEQANKLEPQLRKAIEGLLEADDNYDGYGHYGPLFLRLAWHASGTYDQRHKNGGSNGGCMRFDPEASHGANAGLDIARDRLEVIKKKFPTMSYADIYTFAGKVAADVMAGAEEKSDQVPFRFGRSDFQPKVWEVESIRLPDAARGSDHVREVFTTQMGFTDQEIVALLGAHAVGKMHLERSGFSSSVNKGEALPWTYAPTTLGSHYYTTLLEEKWTERPNPFNDGQVQWENERRDLIMLPAEIVLLTDPKFRHWVDKYAKDEELWKKDFNKAFGKLLELGVTFP